MSLFAYFAPLLALFGIAVMLIAGLIKLVKWYITEKRIQKIRDNMKGGLKYVQTKS